MTLLHQSIKHRASISLSETIILGLSIVMAALSNEFSGIVCFVAVLFAFLGRAWVRQDASQATTHLLLMALSLAAFAVIYLAPGNEI